VNGFGIRELLVESSDNKEEYIQLSSKRKAISPFKEALLMSENIVHESIPSAMFGESNLEKSKIVIQPTEKRRERDFSK